MDQSASKLELAQIIAYISRERLHCTLNKRNTVSVQTRSVATVAVVAMERAQLLKVVMAYVLAAILISNAAINRCAAASSRQLLVFSSSSSSSEEGVVGYWEDKLHGVSMPPMLRAMVTPLKASEADFLITKIRSSVLDQNGHTYLPSNAPSFCKRTSIVCDRQAYVPTLACSYQHNYGKFTVESENLQHGGFFRQKQTLVKGARIEMNNPQKDDDRYKKPRAFLPRGLVQLFPFTKEGLPQMASMLSISKDALPSMQETVSDCFSQAGLPGEIMSCPTSIEAMADFVASTMGSEKPLAVLDLSHHMQDFDVGKTQTVLDVKTVKGDLNDKYVTCHDMFFPFRVFYCHYLHQTKLFVATLQATDGSIHDRAAVCHYDTSHWNPKHVSFSDLGTKPGESEACHWMAESGLVFLHQ